MKWIIFFFSSNIFCSFLYSQDTIKIISLPEIEVIEQKTKSNTALDFSPTITIEQEQIQLIGAKQISEVLTFSPGINIQNQGGLGGMKTLSMRGMSSSRTLVLLDGMPLNSAQNGSFDLNNIDVSSIDNIEIIRGGASSLFGGSAIGGAINIRTKLQIEEYVKVVVSYGSFNEKSFDAILNVPYNIPTSVINTNGFISFGINSLTSTDNYPFVFSQFGEEKKYYRENADYDNLRLSFTTAGELQINKKDAKCDYKMKIIYSGTDKGIPGPILQGQVNNCNDRLEETDITISVNMNILLPKLKIKTSTQGNFNFLFISDDKENINRFELYKQITIVQCEVNLWNIKNEILGSFSESTLSGDMIDIISKDIVNRNIWAVGYRLEKDLLFNKNLLRFNLAGRYDVAVSKEEENIKNKSALTGNLGIIFRPKDIPLLFRTNISHNFRFPNFNEMYYKNYGTRNILPEKSNNINIGTDYNNIFNYINISLDAFYLNVNDMIIAIPISPITWSARNIAQVLSFGTELAITTNKINIYKTISINNISIAYTLQQNLDKSTKSNTYNKQLTYIPNELGNIMISFNVSDFTIGGKVEYSSHRYFQADNSINAILPSYSTADIFIKTNQIDIYKNCKINLRCDIKNITNTQYFIINNYIMPRRHIRFTANLNY